MFLTVISGHGLYRNIGFEETAPDTGMLCNSMMKMGKMQDGLKRMRKIMLTETFDKDTEQMISPEAVYGVREKVCDICITFLMWWWKR